MSRTVLVCLPFAGGGASFFKKWQPAAPPGLDIAAVQPPGREERYVDDPFTTVEAVVGEAYDRLLPQLADAGRVALFGHSLGAVLAYELAHRLATVTTVTRLFVSGSTGPWRPRSRRATGLPDDAFVHAVRRFAGYTHPAMDDPEMREILLPSLRADVEMHESYVAPRDRPLPVPITALRGRDDELVSAEQCAEWAGATTAGFDLVERDGGHMYLTTGEAGLLRLLSERLADPRPAPPGGTAAPVGR
jgi:surfactin synthase thioesterase subunit